MRRNLKQLIADFQKCGGTLKNVGEQQMARELFKQLSMNVHCIDRQHVCYCVLNPSSSSANCPAVIFSGSSCRVASGSWLNAPSVSGSSQQPSNVIRCSTSSDSVMCSPADNHQTINCFCLQLFPATE